MHELPMVREIVKVALAYAKERDAEAITAIFLHIGELHDMVPAWVERFFHFASRGTIAEGARLEIKTSPVICRCRACKENYMIHIHTETQVRCPACGGISYDILSGNEFFIEGIEIC